VFPDVAVQFGHERLAETHHLGLGASLRVEVGAAFAAADRQTRQRILEDLLESEELHDAQVDGGMKPQAALVRAEDAVVLHPEYAVDVYGAAVVGPRHPKDDLTLGLAQALDESGLGVVGMAIEHDVQRIEHLGGRLMELGFTGIPCADCAAVSPR